MEEPAKQDRSQGLVWVKPSPVEWLALATLLMFAEFLRLPTLLIPWLRDQAAIHAVVERLQSGSLGTAFPMPYTSTLYHRLLGLWFELFGEDVLGPRILAAAWASLALVMTWLLGRWLFGPGAGLLALFLAATSPLLLSSPSVGLPNDPLLVLLTLSALLMGLLRREHRWVFLAGLLFGFSLSLRFFHAFFAPTLALLVVLEAGRGRRVASFAYLAIGSLMGGLPLALLVWGDGGAHGLQQSAVELLGGTLGMHIDLGAVLQRPFEDRILETGRSFLAIAASRMTVAGPTEAPGANLVALLLVLLALPWMLFRGLRRDAESSDRWLAIWLLSGLITLALLIGWRAEEVLPGQAGYRAPRYFVLLYPAPWMAAAALVVRLPKAGLRWAVMILLIPSALLVPLFSGPLELPLGGTFAPLAAVDEALFQSIEENEPDLILVDLPPGSAKHWGPVRFRSAELRDLVVQDEAAVIAQDPRFALALRHPQMHFQLHPQLLDLTWRSWPVEMDLGRVPFPPLSPLEGGGAIPYGPEAEVLVGVSSSRTLAVQAQLLPGFQPPITDRIALWELLQPGLKPSRVVSGADESLRWKATADEAEFSGPGFSLYRFRWAKRRFRALDLAFGLPKQAAKEPSRPWAFPSTLYRPELGYGFNHAFLVGVGDAGGPGGIHPEVPVELRVDVLPGPVAGAIHWSAPCGAKRPVIRLQDEVVVVGASPCRAGWEQAKTPFCSFAPEGLLRLRLASEPQGGLRFNRLELMAVPECSMPRPGGAPGAPEPSRALEEASVGQRGG